MHSKIEKFWNDAGYDVKSNMGNVTLADALCLESWTFYFWAYKGKWEPGKLADEIIAYSDKITGPISTEALGALLVNNIKFYYCYGGKEYSEEEMLQIIKLKAFL